MRAKMGWSIQWQNRVYHLVSTVITGKVLNLDSRCKPFLAWRVKSHATRHALSARSAESACWGHICWGHIITCGKLNPADNTANNFEFSFKTVNLQS